MNFSTYKFRCHGLGNLLTDPRSKVDPFVGKHKTPAAQLLSETTKTYLKELWIKEVFDRERIITTKQTAKGIECETDSLELVEKVLGKKYFKNIKEYTNDHLAGIPDVVDTDFVLDIKTSWDIWTFANVEEDAARKTYYGQLLGYMLLTGKKKAKLAYCLVNLPESFIYDEFRKLVYQGAVPDNEDGEAVVRKMYTYDDIAPEKKVKTFEFELDEEIAEKLINRINIARFYMNALEL